MNIRQHLIYLEKHLLSPEVRTDTNILDQLLSDDFLEFNSQGHTYGKAEVLARLPHEVDPLISFNQHDFQLRMISPDVAQLTYKATINSPSKVTQYSLRSSIWRQHQQQWQLVFHQGTSCKPFKASNNS